MERNHRIFRGKKLAAAAACLAVLAVMLFAPGIGVRQVMAEGEEPLEVTETVEFAEDGTLTARFETVCGASGAAVMPAKSPLSS